MSPNVLWAISLTISNTGEQSLVRKLVDYRKIAFLCLLDAFKTDLPLSL